MGPRPGLTPPAEQERRYALNRLLVGLRDSCTPEAIGQEPTIGRGSKQGVTQKQMARAMRISRRHYINLEQGRVVHWTIGRANQIALLLRMSDVQRRQFMALVAPAVNDHLDRNSSEIKVA